MECNRDDAMWSREVAETKFAMQDFLGAKKFILKAQQLYPPLEGAAQMLAVLDVHIAAQVKVATNETDWYGILQVKPLSDDSTIKRQYRKLALLLHPDKNPAKGAEAAFKLIGEAFGVLSDKTKRYLHDSKRAIGPTVAQATPAAAGAHVPDSPLAFWTACPVCFYRYEYSRIYLNYRLLCAKCQTYYIANDINAPAPKRAGRFTFQTWSQNGGAAAGSISGNGHARAPGGACTAGAGSLPAGGTAGATPAAAAAAGIAANLVQRERVAAEKAELKGRAKGKEELVRQVEIEATKKAREDAKAQEALRRLRKKRNEVIVKGARRKAATKTAKRRRLVKRNRDNDDDDNDEDEGDEDLERSNLGCASQGDVTRKSSRRRRNVAYEPSDDDDFEVLPAAKKFRATTEFMENGRQNAPKASTDTNSVQHVGSSSVSDGRVDKRKGVVNVAGEVETPENESGEEHVPVPDSDFYDFDADRTEVHVNKGQVWAVFDETDGFPRFYCQITEVKRTPFYVEGVWLESIHPQKDNFTWLRDRELSIGTGQFKLGDDFQFDSINTFAHVMTFKKTENVYEVYPKRDEVWAMYADYGQQVPSKDAEGNLKLRYDFVLIQTDFTSFSDQGKVVKLQKLEGYKTLWVPHGGDYALTVTYNLHRFSHRVLSLTVTEKDVQGVPCECVELDPASTPADVILN